VEQPADHTRIGVSLACPASTPEIRLRAKLQNVLASRKNSVTLMRKSSYSALTSSRFLLQHPQIAGNVVDPHERHAPSQSPLDGASFVIGKIRARMRP